MATSILSRELLQSLLAVRTQFGRTAAAEKLALLRECAACRISAPRVLRTYHDALVFHAAYPDSAAVRAIVESELQRVAEAARSIGADEERAHTLVDTGIAGTPIIASYTLDTIATLIRLFPHDIELSWENEPEELNEFLFAGIGGVESAGLIDDGLSPGEWLPLARGAGTPSDLTWLIKQIEAFDCSPTVRDLVFDNLQVYVDWKLNAPGSSRTFTRFPERTTWYDRRPLRRSFDIRRTLARSPGPGQRLGLRSARELIDTASAALAVRHRETDPVTYANPREVTLFKLERGIDIALFAARPGRRTPFESFFGYMIARNRVPMAYGGGWVYFERAAVGINVFDEFRGGESAWLLAQVLRVYHHHYGVQRFVVDPFQFGAGNRDGIRSGAFWFYYRLGFRPQNAKLAELAAEEFARIRADRSYRTSARNLRRMTESQLALELRPVANVAASVPSPTTFALQVTEHTADRHHGDRGRAQAWASRRVRRCLGVEDYGTWHADVRAAFDQLSMIISLIPDLERWSGAQKRSLVALMRAKGGARERIFAQKLQKHPRLRTALSELAGDGVK